jgi:hypothetical protein
LAENQILAGSRPGTCVNGPEICMGGHASSQGRLETCTNRPETCTGDHATSLGGHANCRGGYAQGGDGQCKFPGRYCNFQGGNASKCSNAERVQRRFALTKVARAKGVTLQVFRSIVCIVHMFSGFRTYQCIIADISTHVVIRGKMDGSMFDYVLPKSCLCSETCNSSARLFGSPLIHFQLSPRICFTDVLWIMVASELRWWLMHCCWKKR